MEEPLRRVARVGSRSKATRRRTVAGAWLPGAVAFAIVGAACSSNAPPTPEDAASSPPPSLTGVTVMVLPAQHGPAGGFTAEPVPGLDREISFWLAERAPRVNWVFPDELERILARSPSLDIDLHALAVGSFHHAQVRNIGDPLFGNLNALGALTNARAALVPVAAAWGADSTGLGAAHVSLALIDNRTGRVIWFGVTSGEPGAEGSPEVAATAAESIAALFAR